MRFQLASLHAACSLSTAPEAITGEAIVIDTVYSTVRGRAPFRSASPADYGLINIVSRVSW